MSVLIIHRDAEIRDMLADSIQHSLNHTVRVVATIVAAEGAISAVDVPFDFIAMQASDALEGFNPGGNRAGYIRKLSPTSKLCVFGTGFEFVQPDDLPEECEDLTRTEKTMSAAVADWILRHTAAE